MENCSLSELPQLLCSWYRGNCRSLPWRETNDPYSIWVSEIMLQQTRVEAVKGYYARFLQELPTIEALSQCDDERLHKLWEGLGYYSRVRNLKKAACVLMHEYSGEFPRDYEKVLSLPGIGEYTAGAICSIAFNLPVPAVDGNVLRVMARLRDDARPIDAPGIKSAVREDLLKIYPRNAGEFTQALMELGATLCGPNRQPDCDRCPCKEICLAKSRGTTMNLPVKMPKRQRRQEDRTVLILSCGDYYALEKRPDTGLLAGLWQYPNVTGFLTAQEGIAWADGQGIAIREILKITKRSHIFTHIQWNMQGMYLETANCTGPFMWFTAEEIAKNTALPTAFRQFWEEDHHV